MLRKERKWNDIKCSVKTTKAEKAWKTKPGKKDKCDKYDRKESTCISIRLKCQWSKYTK